MNSISNLSLAAAALISQICIIGIMAVGSFILTLGRRPGSAFGFVVLVLTLCTLVPLMFTEGYAGIWVPVFGGSGETGIERSTSMAIVFVADILCTALLVAATGGSQDSPFQALFFLLPALAIFLREPFGHVLSYSILVAVLYSLLLFDQGEFVQVVFKFNLPPRGGYHLLAYWLVAVLCFALATYIGLITRPT